MIKESHSSPVIWHIYVTLFHSHIFVFTVNIIFFIIFHRAAFLFVFNIIVWTITICLLVTLFDALVCCGWRLFSKRSDEKSYLLNTNLKNIIMFNLFYLKTYKPYKTKASRLLHKIKWRHVYKTCTLFLCDNLGLYSIIYTNAVILNVIYMCISQLINDPLL